MIERGIEISTEEDRLRAVKLREDLVDHAALTENGRAQFAAILTALDTAISKSQPGVVQASDGSAAAFAPPLTGHSVSDRSWDVSNA